MAEVSREIRQVRDSPAVNDEGQPPLKRNRPATIRMPPKVYRPAIPSTYVEPAGLPDPAEGLECLYQPRGQSLWKRKDPPDPRSDIIKFDDNIHQRELEKNLNWTGCRADHRLAVLPVIREYWDVFAEEGLRNPILGFQFVVDTGEAQPVCCRIPRYGMHEAPVIRKICDGLKHNGIIEPDRGPWGAMIVLAAKANQEDVIWNEYVWRLCVSYRKLNSITRPFTFPIRRCDDAVHTIRHANYLIKMDLDSGYWQIPVHHKSKPKLAFFGVDEKLTFAVMPMGALNAAPTFACMMEVLQMEWRNLAEARGIRDTDSKVIIDDVILHGASVAELLKFFQCVLSVLQRYRATVKLKKCRFLTQREEFVGRDILPQGNAPAKSKNEAFRKLGKPGTFHDLRSLIGMFGFYSNWIPFFELRILPWRKLMRGAPRPKDPGGQHKTLGGWTWQHDSVLADMKQAVLTDPILQRPNQARRFYLKTDYSSKGYGAALCQADGSKEAIAAEEAENGGGACMFDKQKFGLRLHPVLFESKATTGPEQADHSHPGEAKAGDFAIHKFRYFLWGRPFTWIADCSSLRAFFEQRDMPNHQLERVRMRLLCYQFTIVHRTSNMVKEVDLLTRYNKFANLYRSQDSGGSQTPPIMTAIARKLGPPIGASHLPLYFAGPMLAPRTIAASRWAPELLIVMGTTGFGEVEKAAEMIGQAPVVVAAVEEAPALRATAEKRMEQAIHPSIDNMLEHLGQSGMQGLEIDVYTATCRAKQPKEVSKWLSDQLGAVSAIAAQTTVRAVALFFHSSSAVAPAELKQFETMLKYEGWSISCWRLQNIHFGGAMDTCSWAFVLVVQELKQHLRPPEGDAREYIPFTQRLTHRMPPEEELCLDVMDIRPPSDGRPPKNHKPKPWGEIRDRASATDAEWTKVYDPNHPAPGWDEIRSQGQEVFGRNSFGTACHSETYREGVRKVQLVEMLAILGIDEDRAAPFLDDEETSWEELHRVVPVETITAVLHSIYRAIRDQREGQAWIGPSPVRAVASHEIGPVVDPTLAVLSLYDLNRWTTIPVPSEKAWTDAVAKDKDLQYLSDCVNSKKVPNKADLLNKGYHQPFLDGKLALEGGLWYHYEEPKRARVRQLRTRVVPPMLRQMVFSACHASPMSGHTGTHKTFWRIAVRFWWPQMFKDVTELVKACAHCILANSVSRESSAYLYSYVNDSPFDIMFLDVWTPGEIPSSLGHVKVLTMLEGMCGFAGAAAITKEDSIAVAQATFSAFFVPFGLPRLVVVDAGNPMHGVLVVMCKTLGVPHMAVARGNHRAIRNERFHRFLNKALKITVADLRTASAWWQTVLFSVYAWNASPIDGTDIIRSSAAIGREFPFPIDISIGPNPTLPNEGQSAVEYVESNLPLLRKQRFLLKVLNDERRERHRELKNASLQTRSFEEGDVVIVRRQVQSNAEKQITAKGQFQAKGPYRVLREATPGSYWIQRIPFGPDSTRKVGKLRKARAVYMEKLPSTLCLHKRTDGIDNRFSGIDAPTVVDPLRHILGASEYGRYRRVPDKPYAYVPIKDMWEEEVQESDSEEEGLTENSHIDDDPGRGEEPPEPPIERSQPGQGAGADSSDDDQPNVARTRRSPVAKKRSTTAERLARLNAPLSSDEDEPWGIDASETEEPAAQVDVNDHRKPAAEPPPVAEVGHATELHVLDEDTDVSEQLFTSSDESEKPTPTPSRMPKRPSRKSRKDKRVSWKEGVKPPSTKPTLVALYDAIRLSKDKLVFIMFRPQGTVAVSWALVQVDMEATERKRAVKKGVYRCRWFGPHPEDAKYKSPRESRFWPIVRRLDDRGFFREQHIISPEKVHGFLERRDDLGWYQLDIDLGLDAMTEPFDFATVQSGSKVEKWRISNVHWREMMEEAEKRAVPTSDVDYVPRSRYGRARGGGRGRGRGRPRR